MAGTECKLHTYGQGFDEEAYLYTEEERDSARRALEGFGGGTVVKRAVEQSSTQAQLRDEHLRIGTPYANGFDYRNVQL